MQEPAVLTVSELNAYIKKLFEREEALASVTVKGEISNFTNHYKTGHLYFSVKDEGSIIRAVMFAGSARKLKFTPENGMKVIVTARVAVFERDGQYQLYVSDMQPDGVGALHVAFEQLKRRLAAEGLFDETHKKRLPKMPLVIGVITSPTGAAVRDIIHVLKRRYPIGVIKLCPVLVQGENAAPQLVKAIQLFNKRRLADVIILGRGGGSIEELWAFNEEIVARAVYASEIPIISAVGHETDFTICDFVADMRAPTPSAAAEIAAPSIADIRIRLANYNARVTSVMTAQIAARRARVEALAGSRALQSPRNAIEDRRMQLAYAVQRMAGAIERTISTRRHAFAAAAAKLDALSPLAVLSRGYLIAKHGGKAVRSIEQLHVGDHIELSLADGEAACEITELVKKRAGALSEE